MHLIPAVGGIAPVRINAFILSCRKIVAQRCYPGLRLAVASGRSPPAPAKSSRTTGFQNPEGGRAVMEPIQCMDVFTQAGRGRWSATEKTARYQHIERAPAVGSPLSCLPEKRLTPFP